MISITDKASGTYQDLLNEIAELWDWKQIVKDGDNVNQLWASDSVYLQGDSTGIYVKHINGLNFSTGTTTQFYTRRRYVRTDKALLITSLSYTHAIIIGKTNNNGTESVGIASYVQSQFLLDTMTDNTSSLVSYSIDKVLQPNSTNNVQIVPLTNKGGLETFKDTYLLFVHPSSFKDTKFILDGGYYYCNDCVAIGYTP